MTGPVLVRTYHRHKRADTCTAPTDTIPEIKTLVSGAPCGLKDGRAGILPLPNVCEAVHRQIKHHGKEDFVL